MDTDKILEKLGLRLKQAREAAGLSADEAAARSEIGRTTYWSWENGQQEPSVLRLIRVATVLGASLSDLLGDLDPTSLTDAQELAFQRLRAGVKQLCELRSDPKTTEPIESLIAMVEEFLPFCRDIAAGRPVELPRAASGPAAGEIPRVVADLADLALGAPRKRTRVSAIRAVAAGSKELEPIEEDFHIRALDRMPVEYVRAIGESMSPTIEDGDIIVVALYDPPIELPAIGKRMRVPISLFREWVGSNGSIVVCQLNDDAPMVKRLWISEPGDGRKHWLAQLTADNTETPGWEEPYDLTREDHLLVYAKVVARGVSR